MLLVANKGQIHIGNILQDDYLKIADANTIMTFRYILLLEQNHHSQWHLVVLFRLKTYFSRIQWANEIRSIYGVSFG